MQNIWDWAVITSAMEYLWLLEDSEHKEFQSCHRPELVKMYLGLSGHIGSLTGLTCSVLFIGTNKKICNK